MHSRLGRVVSTLMMVAGLASGSTMAMAQVGSGTMIGPIGGGRSTYVIDATRTTSSFEVKHLGLMTYRGRFAGIAGRLIIDPEARDGEVNLTIETATLRGDSQEMESLLRGEEFFDVERHPRMQFRSAAVRFDGDRLVGADGSFTMIGVTRPLTLAIRSLRCDDRGERRVCEGVATGTLKRSSYGMTKFLPWVSDNVAFQMHVVAVKD